MRIHILGVCGTFMGGLALLARQLGHEVTGSDANVYPPMSTLLQQQGITLLEGYDPAHLDPQPDLVIIGNAMARGNPCVETILERNIPYVSGPQWLHDEVLRHRWVIAVAGTHGKTTTAGMVNWILEACGYQPGFVIGGVPGNFEVSARLGDSPFFVIEADESDGSFMQYPTEIAIITNVGADHLVNWGTPEAYADGFRAFATRPHVRHVVINIDDDGARALAQQIAGDVRSVVTYGESVDADVRITDVAAQGNGVTATLTYGQESGPITLQVPGNHNLANASAAYAAGRLLGHSHDACISGLARYVGTLRRFQLITDTAGIRVFDDYAHHPTEIRAALTAARRATEAGNEATGLPGRLIACFQPHLYSRTVDFSDEFGQVMTLADIAVINDVCGAREDPIPGVTGQLVVDAARRHGAREVVYVVDKYDLPAALNEIARPGDRIITLGCGDVTIVGPLLAPLLAARPEAQDA